ncbi:MAG: hypothetical protein J2P36_14880 [Ktedonobacteraceae bacterium]|nr:hypothetical protein [Ktedonobacteraceae bacterium]
MRNGLALLVKDQIIRRPTNLRINGEKITITTNTDHQAFQQALDEILATRPEIKQGPYWAEFFCYWLAEKYFQTKEVLVEERELELPSTGGSTVQESSEGHTGAASEAQFIDNERLRPIPQPLLSRLIQEVQRHGKLPRFFVELIENSHLFSAVLLNIVRNDALQFTLDCLLCSTFPGITNTHSYFVIAQFLQA